METGKTDETDFVGNQEFLRTVFGGELGRARPVVVSFKGDPRTVPKKVWFGRPWQGSSARPSDLPADANNYFSLAVFRPDEAGKYRRQKARFQALYAVMLDDVGSKVPTERLTLPPSWLLETSPGNCQAGYLLREPLADGLAADRLMNAIVAAGLCDPGANGPRARLARLPVAVNGKHTPPFACRMRAWSPELRYSVEELAAGLQLEMARLERPRRQGIELQTRAAGRRGSGVDTAPGRKRRLGRAAEPRSLQGAAWRGQARHHLPLGAGAHRASGWRHGLLRARRPLAYRGLQVPAWSLCRPACPRFAEGARHRAQCGANEADHSGDAGGTESGGGCGRARTGAVAPILPARRADRDRGHRPRHPRNPRAGDRPTGPGAGVGGGRDVGAL